MENYFALNGEGRTMAETDVVVLGSGAAGLAAALTAAAGGARVTVLESTAKFGGTSAISGGGMWLPGNSLDPNYTDSLADAKTYLDRLTLGLIPEAILDRFLAEAGKIPDFFAANCPLTFSADIGRPDYHAPWKGSSLTSRTVFPNLYELTRLGDLEAKVRRPGAGGIAPIQHSEEFELAHDPAAIERLLKERLEKRIVLRGQALVGGLMEGCLSRGVSFNSETRGRGLIVENGKVAGLRAEQNGQTIEFRARLGVILASGGFEWNRELWTAFTAVPWDGPATPPGNRGDGLMMAAQAGAKLANLDKVTWCQARYLGETYEGEPYMRSTMSGAYPGEILVNRKGRRFTNETLNYNDIGRIFTHFDPNTYEYDNYPAFAVGDRRVHQTISAIAADKGDGWVEADTLDGLAELISVDPDGLAEQVKEFNEHAVRGVDPVYHRGEKPWEVHFLPDIGTPNRSIAPIVDPPFIGYRVRASVFGTRGGPVINENAQIVGWDNRPIPGLFGAGNVVAHPFASAYPGGGGTLGPAVTFGHIAGKTIFQAN